MEGKKQHCLMSKLTAFGGQKQPSDCRRQDECGCDKGESLAIFAADKNQCKQMMCINSYGSIAGQTRKTSGSDENNNGDKKKKKVLEDGEKRDSADDFGGAPTVADIIGSFGWFQFLVLLFSGLREGAVGYDAVIMSVILQPEWDFRCADPVPAGSHLSSWSNNSSQTNLNVTEENFHCFRSLNGRVLVDELSGEPLSCRSWLFPNNTSDGGGGGTSLVAEWSLVCHRHWLVAAIECAYFLGLVTGNLVWGYYADKVGRRRAYLLAHSLALLFGWLAIFMPTMELFATCRFFCAFGSIGYNIIYSIQVEIIGTEHRSFSTTLNHLGWGIGVISVPFVARAFDDYRFIIAVGPMLTLLMFPWAFWLPESSRWLMANGQPQLARHELIRAAKFNGKRHDEELEVKIFNMNSKLVVEKRKNSSISHKNDDDAVSQYSILFGNPILVRDTLLLSCASFTGHLFYYVLTINFGYIKNLSQEANFITSGAGEWFSVIAGALLLRICSRKFCMSLCLATTSLSFIFQALIDIGHLPHLDTELIITANNTVGTLSSLLLIFVTLIVNQEVYPTVIRQTGSSIVNTIGESGSTIAPLLIQFARIVGPWRADLLYSLMCLLASIGVQFVTKTDGMELKDT